MGGRLSAEPSVGGVGLTLVGTQHPRPTGRLGGMVAVVRSGRDGRRFYRANRLIMTTSPSRT